MSISINLRSLSRSNRVAIRLFHPSFVNFSSAASNYLNYDKDPTKSFFNNENQKLLKSITRLHVEKIFRKRTVESNDVEYKFMTAKQLEEEIRSKFKTAENLLQMPPVVKMMEEQKKVISKDPAISNFSESSFVFTDVTFGLKNSDRSIVIRHPDGVLEEAPFDVRKRAYQIYFPMSGRKFRELKMFEPENLKRLMTEEEYEFTLDRACLQYEPYEPRFHEITSQIYQHINEHQNFDKLRSTRHFGPMSFFFAWHKIIDDLVLDMIRRDYLRNAVELICLMYKLNAINDDTSILKTLERTNEIEKQIQSTINQLLRREEANKIEKNSMDLDTDELCFAFVQDSFVKNHSLKKPLLEMALQTYKERHNELKNIAAGVN